MSKPQNYEPLFISEKIKAEMLARGYAFEPPAHVSTLRLGQVLAALSDSHLTTWPRNLTKHEFERRRCNQSPSP